MRDVPLFRGLTRPAMYLGIPLPWFAAVFLVGTGSFMFLPFRYGFFGTTSVYAVLWLVAMYEPRLPEILIVVARKTRRTKNRRINGGDLYRA